MGYLPQVRYCHVTNNINNIGKINTICSGSCALRFSLFLTFYPWVGGGEGVLELSLGSGVPPGP